MPPQGPPQGGPPQGPPGGAPPGGAPQAGGPQNLLVALDKAIDALAQNVASDKSAPPKAVQLIQSIDQQFGEFMDIVNGGGGSSPDIAGGGGQGQTVSPEAAGNKGAIPSPM